VFFDTNILLYSISRSETDQVKRKIATELIDRSEGSVSVQVLQEFYVQATRVSSANRIPHHLALVLINSWRRFSVQEHTVAILDDALRICYEHHISYWDSAVVAAAKSQDCRVLYTEDLNHTQIIEGVQVLNPFK